MVTELFANLPSTTVSSGGTDAPAGGTPETWTVASSTSFPAAVTGASQFHVSDPAAPSEIMAVTNVSGSTWTVTRGAESTTPVTHGTGFTVKQVVTAGFLTSLSPVSGQFLCTPTQYAPGTQTSVQVVGTTMAAFSSVNISTGSFIAPSSTSVVITASFVGSSSGASAQVAVGLAPHGSVSPIFGYSPVWEDSSANIARPATLQFLVTGLSVGSSYNFDLVGASKTGGTFSILAYGQSTTTPNVGGASGNGGPVTLAVQAI